MPYRCGGENRRYRPDFLLLVDDGREDLLHLVVEIKGFRNEDAKDKKLAMDTYWIPGVNNAARFGRWAFAEFTSMYAIESDFIREVEGHFNTMIEKEMDGTQG